MNLQGANAQLVHQNNIAIARQRLQQHLVLPQDPPIHDTIGFVCANSQFVDINDITLNTYAIFPTTTAGVEPTIVNLCAPNNAQLMVARVVSISLNAIGFKQVTQLEDDASALTAGVNTILTFGPKHTILYHPIPNPLPVEHLPRFLVATNALYDRIRSFDPDFQPVALAAPIQPAPPGPMINDQLLQVLQGHNNAQHERQKTVGKVAAYERFTRLANLMPEGRFLTSSNTLMFAKPDDQAPSAAFFSSAKVIQMYREFFFDYAQHMAKRTITITDMKLESFILLNFSGERVSFTDFTTPEDLPLTFTSMIAVVNRVCDLIAITFGAPLARALLESAEKIKSFHDLNDVTGLLPSDVLNILGRHLYLIDREPAFDIDLPRNDRSLADNLLSYFTFRPTDSQIQRLLNSRIASDRDAASKPAASTVVAQANKRRKVVKQPTSTQPTTVVTRSKTTYDKVVMDNWRAQLNTTVPALAGVKLGCLYFIANKPPCLRNATCQKGTFKQDHVVNALISANSAAILAWLATDPMGRF